MSRFTDIADKTTHVCAGALTMLLADPVTGAITAATGVSGLAALGLKFRGECAETACKKAAAAAVKALANAPGFADVNLTDVNRLLSEAAGHESITQAELLTAHKGKTPATRIAALVDLLTAKMPLEPHDALTKEVIHRALTAAMTSCYNNEALREQITRELVVDIANGVDGIEVTLAEVKEDTTAIRQELRDIKAMLANPAAQSDADLQEVANGFGATETLPRPQLLAFLKDKAADLARLSAEIEALRGRSPRIDNIASEAAAAVQRGELDKAQALIDSALEIQATILREPLENNAALMVTRAEIDLIAGRTEAAFQTLSTAADSFAALDKHEPVRKRLTYQFILYQHGLRYGGDCLTFCGKMLRDGIGRVVEKEEPFLFADAQVILGNALQIEGRRRDGAAGAELLAQAVISYEGALTIYTKDDNPVDWATTQSNLGGVLQEQGSRTNGHAAAKLLARSVAALGAALTVFTKENHPVQWARAQNNLGVVLNELGVRTYGKGRTDFLARSVSAYENALTIYTKDAHPVDWAGTQNNLGISLHVQGIYTEGNAGAELLVRSVKAFKASLTIRIKDKYPVQWAMTQNNLGLTLKDQGIRTDGRAGAELLVQAFNAFEVVLAILTKDDHGAQWALTNINLAQLEEARADHDSTGDPIPHLNAALGHITAALTILDPDHMPYDHAKAITLRDRLLARLAE